MILKQKSENEGKSKWIPVQLQKQVKLWSFQMKGSS